MFACYHAQTFLFSAKYVMEIIRGVGKRGRKQAVIENNDDDDVFMDNPADATDQIKSSLKPVEDPLPEVPALDDKVG
jgi:hypothetical protein